MARAELLLKGKRLCALASGGVLITFAVLSLVGCFISFLWVTPIGWMIIISSIWYAAFGGTNCSERRAAGSTPSLKSLFL